MAINRFPLQRECDAFYGNPRGPGNAVVNAKWYKNNITLIVPPFAMAMGSIKITRIATHVKCAPALAEWLEQVWRNSSRHQATINRWGMNVFSGSFNYRPMRGLSALSMHAYGCAFDFDAPRNGLGNRQPNFARPEMRDAIVAPFLKLGGIWGGDWDGDGSSLDEPRCDGMHFQFARLR